MTVSLHSSKQHKRKVRIAQPNTMQMQSPTPDMGTTQSRIMSRLRFHRFAWVTSRFESIPGDPLEKGHTNSGHFGRKPKKVIRSEIQLKIGYWINSITKSWVYSNQCSIFFWVVSRLNQNSKKKHLSHELIWIKILESFLSHELIWIHSWKPLWVMGWVIIKTFWDWVESNRKKWFVPMSGQHTSARIGVDKILSTDPDCVQASRLRPNFSFHGDPPYCFS